MMGIKRVRVMDFVAADVGSEFVEEAAGPERIPQTGTLVWRFAVLSEYLAILIWSHSAV